MGSVTREDSQIEGSPKEGALMSPIGLDKILQITCFLPVVQGNDLRYSVSHPRLILPGVELRTAGKVEGGVTGLGQKCGIFRGVVVLGEDR